MKLKEQRETHTTGVHYRFMPLDRKTVDTDKRTVRLAFSSEAPVERWFGQEILDHSKKSIRMDHIEAGAALLREHDRDKHIGTVEGVTIGRDRIGRAEVRFGNGAQASEAFQDVQDGILKQVSVGYLVHKYVNDGEPESEIYRAVDWQPLEISLVAVAADPGVGVGREAEQEIETVFERAAASAPAAGGEPDKGAAAESGAGGEPASERTGVTVHITGSDLSDEAITQVAANINDAARGVTVVDKDDEKIAQARKETSDAEADRRNSILELGEKFSEYVDQKDISNALRNGHTEAQFRDLVMEKMQTKHTDTREAHIGMTAGEVQRYSLARAVVAAATGDWRDAGLEQECSRAVAKSLDQRPEGFFMPYDAFQRDFIVGGEAGNWVPTDLRVDQFVDVLRNNMVLASLGIRFLAGLRGNVDIPTKATPTAIAMLTEVEAMTPGNPTTGLKQLRPKRMGAQVEYSLQSIIQSAIAVEPMLRDDLLQGTADKLQDQAINGDGTGSNIRGIRNTAGIGSVTDGVDGGALNWAKVVELESACANQNAEPDQRSGYLLNTKTRGKAKTVQKATNLPFIWDNGAQPLNGYRAAVSNVMPSNLSKGTSSGILSSMLFGSDWSMSVIGLFGAPDIVVDPYSKAGAGKVIITINQFADQVVRRVADFAVQDDIITT